ncbi:hypothetical protein HB364_13555 [Pseudoflavitalea sp. X16]|uniref:hypothetical protein n=1 Tax=Paraflavitalea devenefica TaxID=2716334 RepID=UPI001421A9B1|nr:hypothetical protein [Paraflavitalea devenefica]NII26115.1 hypothetical protein [Paraflavitalea devenefica]
MDITLKKIKVVDEFSEETIAFTADVIINRVKAGIARNHGRGGNTMVTSYNEQGVKLIRAAEKWVKNQKDDDGRSFDSLGDYVDDLLSPHLKSLDQKDYLNTIKKLEERNILFGPPFGEIFNLTLKYPISLIQASPNGVERLAEVIRKDILPQLTDGAVILNGNLLESIKEKFDAALFFKPPITSKQKSPRKRISEDPGRQHRKKS